MATVYSQRRKRASGVKYAVFYRDPVTGKNHYYRTFDRKKDAEQAMHELRSLLLTGKVPQHKKRFRLLTFGDAGELLESNWQDRVLEGELRENTREGYRQRLANLNKVFGRRLLCEISEEELRRFRIDRATAYSNVTSNRDLFIINQVFKVGMAEGALRTNPTAGLNYLSEKAHERNLYLLPEDLNRLVETARIGRAGPYLPALIYLGAEHGASKQEALSLRWRDVNFDFQGKGLIYFFRTKTSAERTEVLMPRTRDALLAWRAHLAKARERRRIEAKGDWVFCRLDGTPLKSFTNAWRSARRRVGMEDLHFHDLRHTFCSNACLVGANLKDVKEMIGHKDLAMTDRYSHLPTIRKQALQQELARHYAGEGPADR